MAATEGYMRAEGTFHIPGLAVRYRFWICLLFAFLCLVLIYQSSFFLNNAALVITTVAVMKLC